MAVLSIASFRAVWMAVLSSSVQVLIVKVGALHLIETSVDAGLFEMVVVQVVIVEGKTALGASSPANPALHMPEPLSTTRAATSS